MGVEIAHFWNKFRLIYLKFLQAIYFSKSRSEKITRLKKNSPESPQTSDFPETFGNGTIGSPPVSVTKSQYETDFKVFPGEQPPLSRKEKQTRAKRAFEFVVETRRFEIELYWKRATYFWAFIAAIFLAYVALKGMGHEYSFEAVLIAAVGVVLSMAWHFSNIGSKSWQRHWEKHLDLIEDDFMGPPYKTVNTDLTFSVSKINEIVSFVFIFVWLALFANTVSENYSFAKSLQRIEWIETGKLISVKIALVLVLSSMLKGKGRGRFKTQSVKMYRRDYFYE